MRRSTRRSTTPRWRGRTAEGLKPSPPAADTGDVDEPREDEEQAAAEEGGADEDAPLETAELGEEELDQAAGGYYKGPLHP